MLVAQNRGQKSNDKMPPMFNSALASTITKISSFVVGYGMAEALFE